MSVRRLLASCSAFALFIHAFGQWDGRDTLVTPQFHRHALELSMSAQEYGLTTYEEEKGGWPYGDGAGDGLGFGLRYARAFDGTWGAALGLDVMQLAYWGEVFIGDKQYEALNGRFAHSEIPLSVWGCTRLTLLGTHTRRYNRRWR